jgi:hypothetical protein
MLNGILTGATVIPAVAAGNDNVDVSACSCNLNGVVTSVSADTDISITRPATAKAKVNSLTINSSGTYAMVAGTDSSDTTFSETRGAAGGPPLIPVTSIEVAQIRVVTNTAGVITTAQIYSTVGTHREEAGLPGYTINYFTGTITLDSALPLNHTGPAARSVWASVAQPVFTDLRLATDFVPPANSHTTNSRQLYRFTRGSTSSSLGSGSFVALLDDGIVDGLMNVQDEIVMTRFYPDYTKTPYRLDQGKLGISLAYPPDADVEASCTLNAETLGVSYSS